MMIYRKTAFASDDVAHICAAESLVQLGYAREQIEQSLEMERYDEVWAAYHLLALPLYAVSDCCTTTTTTDCGLVV